MQREKGHFDYMKDEEWLYEINIMLKIRKFMEFLLLLDFFRYDTFLFIVTELCICDLQKPITQRAVENLYYPEEMIRLALGQMIQALLVLHASQILHRDLKPQNIFIRSVQPLQLVLADFGISRDLEG